MMVLMAEGVRERALTPSLRALHPVLTLVIIQCLSDSATARCGMPAAVSKNYHFNLAHVSWCYWPTKKTLRGNTQHITAVSGFF